MTTKHISHTAPGKGTRQGRRFVLSHRRGDAAGDASAASRDFQLFNPGSVRVHRRPVTITPASVAGLMLACASITACKHAVSQPLNDATPQNHETGTARARDRSVAPTLSASASATKPAHAKPSAPMRSQRAGAAAEVNTPRFPFNDAERIAATSSTSEPATAATSAMAETDIAMVRSSAFANDSGDRHDAILPPPADNAVQDASIMVPMAKPTRAWSTWGAPAAATVVVSAGLLMLARRRRTRRNKADETHTRVIDWKGWSYRAMSPSRTEFFGAERPDLPEAWAVDRVQLHSWIGASDAGMKPATDGRYGLMKPIRPPKIDLSLDDAAFIHWASSAPVSPPSAALTGTREEPVARTVHVSVTEPRRITEATAQTQDYDNSSSADDDVAMAPAPVSALSPALQPMQVDMRAMEATQAERDAMAQEQEQQEALRLAHLQREALAREAMRAEAERLEAERRLTMERETARVAAEQRAAQEVRRQREESTRLDAVTEAKKQLTAGYASKALDALAPILATPHADGEAWTVAGWCWWRMARDNGPDAERAVAQAIQAFHHAIAADPDREAMLGSALIRCHLFMADHLRGDARAASLDTALQLMGNASATRRGGDTKFVQEHAGALYERALLSAPEERAHQLEQARQILAELPARDVDADARWQMVTIELAQAQQLQGRAADAALARIADRLAHVPSDATQDMRDTWLARLIDVELLRLRPLKGAARLMRLRQLRDAYAPQLAEARSILPLLSWIQVLRDWAGMLSERPAREKLAEAESLFERIESLSPDDIGSVHFARAYYLRLRSAHESISAALETLDKADALLAKAHSPVLSAETISLERAEIALARAPLLDPRERRAALEQAIRYSDRATAVEDGNLSRALSCGISARLGKFDGTPPPAHEALELADLAWRLINAAPYEPEAMRLSARGELAAGNAEVASQLCEAAWDAGCRDADLLRLWRESLTRLPNTLADAANDPQWKRLNQCMRLAQSIGLATQ